MANDINQFGQRILKFIKEIAVQRILFDLADIKTFGFNYVENTLEGNLRIAFDICCV